MMHRNLMAALLAIAIGAPASAQDVSGVWKVAWAAGMRIQRDGSVEVENWGEATLDLRQEGDRVSGTWIRSVEGEGTARWSVVGTFREGLLALSATEGEADTPVVRAQLDQIESLNWEGKLTDDRLEGEMWLIIPEAPRAGLRRPWHAER